MLRLFKKNSEARKEDYTFLKSVTEKLSSKYPYLLDQVSDEFIIGKKVNKLGDKGSYTLTLNAKLESKFSNKNLPKLFLIQGIKIWNKSDKSFEEIELHILEGMLAGFKIESNYSHLDYNKIDISEIKEKHFRNDDKKELLDILNLGNEKYLKFIDLDKTFKIEIDEGDFYVIKDLEDGNYLGMDQNGAVYGMMHDPYEIEKIYDNKETFFNDLELGKFSIEEYYNKKMGG